MSARRPKKRRRKKCYLVRLHQTCKPNPWKEKGDFSVNLPNIVGKRVLNVPYKQWIIKVWVHLTLLTHILVTCPKWSWFFSGGFPNPLRRYADSMWEGLLLRMYSLKMFSCTKQVQKCLKKIEVWNQLGPPPQRLQGCQNFWIYSEFLSFLGFNGRICQKFWVFCPKASFGPF